MKLEDLLPEAPEFRISSTGKVYRLRPPNMRDQVWFQNRYGSTDGYKNAIQGEDWNEIAVVVFYLLSQEDKRDFLAADVKIIDETGVEKMVHHTGPEMLLVSLAGIGEMLEVMKALTKAICISNPLAEAMAKKKLTEMHRAIKQTPQGKPTGPERSISSARSTDKGSKRSRS